MRFYMTLCPPESRHAWPLARRGASQGITSQVCALCVARFRGGQGRPGHLNGLCCSCVPFVTGCPKPARRSVQAQGCEPAELATPVFGPRSDSCLCALVVCRCKAASPPSWPSWARLRCHTWSACAAVTLPQHSRNVSGTPCLCYSLKSWVPVLLNAQGQALSTTRGQRMSGW